MTCVALVYIAWLYTGAAALCQQCDNSIVVVLLLCVYWRLANQLAYRHILCVNTALVKSTKAIWLHIIGPIYLLTTGNVNFHYPANNLSVH